MTLVGVVGIESGALFAEHLHIHTTGKIEQPVVESPCVIVIEPAVCDELRFRVIFGEPGYAIAVLEHTRGCFAPELVGRTGCIVAAVAVYVELADPVLHGIDHGLVHGCIVDIELIDIVPAIGAIEIIAVIFGVGTDPDIIFRGVVSHPVEPYLHAVCVYGVYERAELVGGPVVGVDRLVVFHGVGAGICSPLADVAEFVYGHKPDYVHAQFPEARYLAFHAREISLGGEIADEYFIYHPVFRHTYIFGRADGYGREQCQSRQQERAEGFEYVHGLFGFYDCKIRRNRRTLRVSQPKIKVFEVL